MQNIEQTTFYALERGKNLVVLGAVHGNEQCGTKAIRQAISKFHTGEWELQSGKVTFVPICNPKAYGENKRFYERNLNRHFYPKPIHVDYEDKIDPILCKILDEADSLLDIHSYQSEGGAFCFLGTSSSAEIAYSRSLNAPLYIYGWADAFAKSATKEQRLAGLGTTDYVRANGKSGMAVTLECGNHHNPNNAQTALQAIQNAMIHLGLMEGERPPVAEQIAIKMSAVYYKEKSGRMAQSWKHGDFLQAGELIAIYDDGERVTAASDGFIILPKVNLDADIGSEWFYFGVQTDFPT